MQGYSNFFERWKVEGAVKFGKKRADGITEECLRMTIFLFFYICRNVKMISLY